MADNIFNEELLIGIIGEFCDYMIVNGKCELFCPYAPTRDKDDECKAWREINDIRMRRE